MTRLRLPTSHPALNRFLQGGAGAPWWEQAEPAEGVRRGLAGEVTTLEWDTERPLAPRRDTTLVVTEPVTAFARTPEDVRGWAEAVLAADRTPEAVVLAVKPDPPTGIDELLAAAAGRRWPLLDPGRAYPMPEPPDEPELRRFAELVVAELAEQVASMSAPSEITRALGVTDAVTALRYATADVGDGTDPAAMRAATDAAAQRFVDAGVRRCGPIEALHWPRPAADGRLATDVAARIAVAVLRGAVERADPLTAGLDERMAEIDALEDRVRAAEDERPEVSA